MQIHATNIQGLGASQVVKSFLDASSNLGFLEFTNIYLPYVGELGNYIPKKGIVKRYKRILPNNISRLIECLFSSFLFPNIKTIVLGDIPLRGINNQIVLVHQPNLVYPKVNSNSSRSIGFRINRLLFYINNKYATTIIVQTGVMADDLVKSYPSIKDKIIIAPQPVPNWLKKEKVETKNTDNRKIVLFYPSAYYPHKRHDFLLTLNKYVLQNSIAFLDFEIWITLDDNHYSDYESISFVKNLGRLSPDKMNIFYQKVDALLFLSSMESYGLPLIEAVTLNLPILTVDFLYSRWICEDQAYYFDLNSEISFFTALSALSKDYKLNKIPDYTQVLKKFPSSWDEVVKIFIN